ncbi:hypothetical protein HNQ50_002463 [Silvimonas terrae]|uniref:Uncharacterized protein n=1 Tax=Silvimonas terrae TaxID=300266 RepID=A0A840RHI6_9NEIS|nr:hypothetical protein [Silvimonas terrae]
MAGSNSAEAVIGANVPNWPVPAPRGLRAKPNGWDAESGYYPDVVGDGAIHA